MSDATASTTTQARDAHEAADLAYRPTPGDDGLSATPQRSFLRKAFYDTFNQFGARVGAIWIALLALLAITAPYVASSHPILMKADGKWSSPMWTYLTPADIVLTITAFVAAVLLVVHRIRSTTKMLIILGTVVVVAIAAYSLKHPPTTINYAQYRQLERQGGVERIVRTIIPYSPTDRLRDMPERRLQPPSLQNWMGTESEGADLLSRMIHASRIALSIGLISTSISTLIGILIGGIMGYYVGKVDLLGMRLIEIFEAVPGLLVLITVMAAWQKRDIYVIMVVIGLLGWTGTARFIRGEFLKLRQQDFVQAAIATGMPQWIVIYRHILPNGLTPILVTSTFGVASAILLESTLSFLGLGLIDEPSWGQMLNQARSGGTGFVWWMAIFPGGAIFLTFYAYALIGDAVRDAIDPKLRKRD